MEEKWSQKPEKFSVSQNDEVMILDNEDVNPATKNKRVKIRNLQPYKVYTALLTQAGPQPPTPTILENSLGNISWNRTAVGTYTAEFSIVFPSMRVMLYIENFKKTENHVALISANVTANNTITIYTFEGGEDVDLADGLLDNTSFEVRVYS